jgi:HD-GYP domain-containing protein (c-di-GMP phosphodiesterase class II)
VHDLGRLAIPADILASGGLTTDEMLIVQEHPALGAALLTQLPALRHLAPIVIAALERWDGDGYPRGLRGTAIPVESRILAITEAYDALTTQRPYRPAVADAAAVAEVLRCAGAQFDPDLVRCWLRTHEGALPRVH